MAHARPVLDKLRTWVDMKLPHVTPRMATGKAVFYLHEQWPRLVRYLVGGRLEVDNNRTENATGPCVTGRKNWIFSDTVHGYHGAKH